MSMKKIAFALALVLFVSCAGHKKNQNAFDDGYILASIQPISSKISEFSIPTEPHATSVVAVPNESAKVSESNVGIMFKEKVAFTPANLDAIALSAARELYGTSLEFASKGTTKEEGSDSKKTFCTYWKLSNGHLLYLACQPSNEYPTTIEFASVWVR